MKTKHEIKKDLYAYFSGTAIDPIYNSTAIMRVKIANALKKAEGVNAGIFDDQEAEGEIDNIITELTDWIAVEFETILKDLVYVLYQYDTERMDAEDVMDYILNAIGERNG